MEKVLHLTLHKRWFDEIFSGKKKEEYRDIKPYWTARLFDKEGKPKRFDIVSFKNGYGKDARSMKIEFKGIAKRNGRYVIRLGGRREGFL